jgi:hypothetical protein
MSTEFKKLIFEPGRFPGTSPIKLGIGTGIFPPNLEDELPIGVMEESPIAGDFWFIWKKKDKILMLEAGHHGVMARV